MESQLYKNASTKLIEQIIQLSPVGIAVIDFDGNYVAVNPAYLAIYLYTRDEMIGRSFTMVFPLEQRASSLTRHQQFLNEGGALNGEWDVVRHDGSILRIMSESVPVPGEDGRNNRLVYVTNLTERRKMERVLEESEARFSAMFAAVPQGILAHNLERQIISCNEAAGAILHLKKEDIENKQWQQILQGARIEGCDPFLIESILTDDMLFQNAAIRNKYVEVALLNGQKKWLEISIVPIFSDASISHIYSIFADVTQRVADEIDSKKQATTDFLTGLNNRRSLMHYLKGYFDFFLRQPHKNCSVLNIDIDHFKDINEQYGRATGDNILILIAKKMQEIMRPYDIVARVGGEEFSIILPDTDQQEAGQFAEKLRIEIECLSYSHEGQDIAVTISVGVSQIRELDEDLENVLFRSDWALYNAKGQGRNRVKIYD